MGLFAYGTVLRKQAGAVTITSSTLGYSECVSEDEARGLAVRKAHELKPAYDIVQVNVIEIDLAPTAPPTDDACEVGREG